MRKRDKREVISEGVNEHGHRFVKYKLGKKTVTCTCFNEPSEEAINNACESLVEILRPKVPEEILKIMTLAEGWKLVFGEKEECDELMQSLCERAMDELIEEENRNRRVPQQIDEIND